MGFTLMPLAILSATESGLEGVGRDPVRGNLMRIAWTAMAKVEEVANKLVLCPGHEAR